MGQEVAPQPKVAILLATYNGSRHIVDQMTSLLGQTGVDAHVFVRDDGSTDATLEILRGFIADNPARLTLVDDALGSSGSAATNFFRLLMHVEPARFDFFAFADQDDVWFPDKLDRAVGAISAAGAWGYSSNLLTYDPGRGRAWVLDKAQPQRDWDYLFQTASAGCTYVFGRDAMVAVRACLLEQETMSAAPPPHDWLVYAICRSAGHSWICDAEARIVYRQHDANVHGALPGLAGLAERLQLLKARWYRRHVLAVLGLLRRNAFQDRVHAAVERLNWADRFWLASHASHFRRKPRDRILLAASILAGWF